MINFNLNKSDSEVVEKIADKALDTIIKLHGDDAGWDKETIMMDLTVCHLNGCKLKFNKMLDADNFNLLHDIIGINRHLDHNTGMLKDCFLPRFSAD